MSQSLSKLFVHAIFHVKSTSPLIFKEDKEKLYSYIATIIKDKNSIPIEINGTEDHLHILFVLSKNLALSKMLEEIKKNSSRWIKGLKPAYRSFAWQGGYSGFSVSPSLQESTKKYIQNQEVHHQKLSLKEELILFFNQYGIDYDDRYLLRD
jgi:REP element-mobilizing transposase RayT